MSIIHNMASMSAQRQYKITSGKRAKSAEKLSSGYRINRSADDAAGLQISEKMRWQIRGLNKGQDNIMEGISWTQVGDGAMAEVSSMLQRMTELCVQAANDTNTEEDRQAIQEEINELRKEINRIGDATEFNTQQVFQNEDVMMDIDGVADSFNIFNSSYDDQTGKVEYGGFVIGGTRVPWNDAAIQPADANTTLPMVSIDPNTNEQIFNAGTYKCTVNGSTIEIKCEDGAKVPELSRIISVSADATGISIDGVLHGWDELKDEDGNGASAGNAHGGVWTLEHNNSSIAFYMPKTVETIDDMVKAVEDCTTSEYTYTLKETYSGSKEEQAVDANSTKGMVVTNSLANNISGSNIAFTVRADDTGVWLEENGTMMADSKQTWDKMGISSWDSGSDIKANYTYIYHDNDGSNDTNISFEYTLSDITSVDSVIDGLDGMLIAGNKVTNNYDMTSETTTDANILKTSMKYNGTVTFEEEKELGRDFDKQTIDKVASDVVNYDETTGIIAVDYVDASQNAVLSYTGIDAGEKAQMTADINEYIDYVLELKKNAAMAGKDPQQISIGTVDLTKVVGSDKITTSGHFDSTVTIDSSTMTNTDGGGSSHNSPGVNGETYPTAYIDFSEMGQVGKYTIDDLWSAGFNSTCKTCTNHYSIVFTDVSSGTTMANGYKYNKVQDGRHYTLEIDINSLKSAGVDTGEELADAIVAITADDFDFHYTQYASEDGKLYIYDNREQTTGTTEATFDTYPFEPLDIGEYSFNLSTGDGRSVTLDYTYSYSDIAKDVVMEWEQDNAGEYVKITNGSSTYYEKYDSAVHINALDSDRYNLKVTYNSDDGTGTKVATDRDTMVSNYSKNAINKMLTGTTVSLNAKDYTTIDVAGEENPNVAIRSLFETDVDAPEYEKGINIQCSSNVGDSVKIPRFALHTVALRLYRANVMTHESASEAITSVGNALDKLSRMRSTYGAYQNRLEHTYASRGNMEENTQASESRIRDADLAEEMVELSKHNILAQAGEAMMSQANRSKEGLLQLLQ